MVITLFPPWISLLVDEVDTSGLNFDLTLSTCVWDAIYILSKRSQSNEKFFAGVIVIIPNLIVHVTYNEALSKTHISIHFLWKLCSTMNSKVLVILLVMLMVPSTTSAFSCLSCDPFFFTRIRTLIFGEYNLLCLRASLSFLHSVQTLVCSSLTLSPTSSTE